MVIFLNGNLVPEEQGMISVFDRSFCLGDGLFETIPITNGRLFLWNEYFERLRSGADFFKIKIPFTQGELWESAMRLLFENNLTDGMLRFQLSRGVGTRGYSAKSTNSQTLVMTSHPARKMASAAKLVLSSVRILSNDPLSRFKTCSKISHVFARTEADEAGADEALLLNTDGDIAEGTSSNFFWIENGTVCTPTLDSGALPGVTRAFVLNLCGELTVPVVEKNIAPDSLAKIDGAFLTSSGIGIRDVAKIGEFKFVQSPITQALRIAFQKYAEGSNTI